MEAGKTTKLTVKQRRFVDAYLGEANGNASEAARIAGYSLPRQSGSENLSKPDIRAAIEARLEEWAMPAREVLARLADHARGSIGDFIEINADGTWRIDLEKARKAGKLHLLTELSTTEHGPKIKIHDAQAALVQLGRHHKLLTDKVENTGADGKPMVVKILRGVSMDDL